MTKVKAVTAAQAARLIEAGARLVDVRAPDEHNRERIAAASSNPLDSLNPIGGSQPVIFHCRTGTRTAMNATRLADACEGEAFLLEGGIESWKAAGLPVVEDRRQPLEIMRQVQLAGGGVILLSVLLALLVAPAWSLLAAAVGIGMLHAGLTGSCAMSRLLAPMPWNRPRPT